MFLKKPPKNGWLTGIKYKNDYTRINQSTECNSIVTMFFHKWMGSNANIVCHSISHSEISRHSHGSQHQRNPQGWGYLGSSWWSQMSCLIGPIQIDLRCQCHSHRSKLYSVFEWKKNNCLKLRIFFL